MIFRDWMRGVARQTVTRVFEAETQALCGALLRPGEGAERYRAGAGSGGGFARGLQGTARPSWRPPRRSAFRCCCATPGSQWDRVPALPYPLPTGVVLNTEGLQAVTWEHS